MRWDDDDDELPISSTETSPAEDQSSFYLNMSSSKTDETIPLVNNGEHQQLIMQDSFPLFKPVLDAEAQDEYLLPIVRV